MTKDPKSTEINNQVQSNRLFEIARLRVIVGYLGERSQHGWWDCDFFSAISAAFLTPVFNKTSILAQYHGVKEAARRVHDEHIGVGRVFHLFRLPESIEQAVFEVLQDPAIAEIMRKNIESQAAAAAVMQTVAGSMGSLREGPVQAGSVLDFEKPRWLADTARCYQAAFSAGVRSYPYFAEKP